MALGVAHRTACLLRVAAVWPREGESAAEALCTKMGIMVAGEFKCFGAAQHVKDKFGKGYEFEVKVRTLTQDEINQKLTPLGFSSFSEIQSADCAKILEQEGNQDLAEELKAEGLG